MLTQRDTLELAGLWFPRTNVLNHLITDSFIHSLKVKKSSGVSLGRGRGRSGYCLSWNFCLYGWRAGWLCVVSIEEEEVVVIIVVEEAHDNHDMYQQQLTCGASLPSIQYC